MKRFPGQIWWPVILLSVSFSSLVFAAETPADTTSTEIEAVTVTAPAVGWGFDNIPESVLRSRMGNNLAQMLKGLPGVAGVQRSSATSDPVIRGMGRERVQTILGAVPLCNACPGRMDPPANYLSIGALDEVKVDREGGVADFGPGGVGGSIQASPDYERKANSEPGVTTYVELGYETAREAPTAQAGIFGGNKAIDVKVGLGYHETSDYEAPDGTVVPAGSKRQDANLVLGWRPSADKRLWNALSVTHEENIDFPSMPMDNIETDFLVYNAGWRSEMDGKLARYELTGGFSSIDHLMDNSMKTSWAQSHNSTDAKTRTWGAHAKFDIRATENEMLFLGLDASEVAQDAVRTRTRQSDAMVFTDRLWPDGVQTNYGGFAAFSFDLNKKCRLTARGRLDNIDSKARAADAGSMGGMTVRQQYVRFYGDEAAETDRSEILGMGSLKIDRTFSDQKSLYLRGGLSTRAAGLTERYYAFAPAPGGFLVGNPTLNSEKKLEGELGFTHGDDKLYLNASVFYAGVSDYILTTLIARQDVTGDGNDDNIKGFNNVDATLYGGELAVEFHPADRFYFPLTVSYVRGENTTDSKDLPEIPALSSTVECRYLAHSSSRTWLKAGGLLAGDQEKIDPSFPEDRTPGYAVWHLGLETHPVKGLEVLLTVDNIFDRLYHDHLTREAMTPTGGLLPGDEIPAMGRHFTATARFEF